MADELAYDEARAEVRKGRIATVLVTDGGLTLYSADVDEDESYFMSAGGREAREAFALGFTLAAARDHASGE